jgi:hypothetical protein
MATWHQKKAGLPILYHPTKWTAYNPTGHLSVMRFDTEKECMDYCKKTKDIPLPPTNSRK